MKIISMYQVFRGIEKAKIAYNSNILQAIYENDDTILGSI